MAALPYINNPFIMDRVDVAGVPINAARTTQFINFMKTFTDQQPKAYPMIRGVTGQVASWGTPFVKGVAGDPIWKLVDLPFSVRWLMSRQLMKLPAAPGA
jgi:hypothetical protein